MSMPGVIMVIVICGSVSMAMLVEITTDNENILGCESGDWVLPGTVKSPNFAVGEVISPSAKQIFSPDG